MPTYEYRCASGHQYEKREGFDAPSKQKCQVCGKGATRVLHAPPIVFKGSGFYKTDSRGSSSATSEPSASSPATPAPASGDGHAHGPGGHTHDATPAPAPAADAESTAAS